MPNLGPTELIIILIIIIVVFGVGKLPEIGGALGKGVKEFKNASKELQEAEKDVKAVADETKKESGTSKSA
jgi:sec-independent protein translocase protein TatA